MVTCGDMVHHICSFGLVCDQKFEVRNSELMNNSSQHRRSTCPGESIHVNQSMNDECSVLAKEENEQNERQILNRGGGTVQSRSRLINIFDIHDRSKSRQHSWSEKITWRYGYSKGCNYRTKGGRNSLRGIDTRNFIFIPFLSCLQIFATFKLSYSITKAKIYQRMDMEVIRIVRNSSWLHMVRFWHSQPKSDHFIKFITVVMGLIALLE